jgi:hypothetical protein
MHSGEGPPSCCCPTTTPPPDCTGSIVGAYSGCICWHAPENNAPGEDAAIACAQSACDQFWTPEYSQYACPEGYVITDCNLGPPQVDPSCGGPDYYIVQVSVSCCPTTTTPPPGCPPGSECTAFVDGQVACVKVNGGAWQRYQTFSPDQLPCGCPNGWTEELLYETGPPEWDTSGTITAYKVIRCIGEASADYATCCAEGEDGFMVPLSDCAAYQQLWTVATNSLDMAPELIESGTYCKPNPLP